jgi:hypothetical protein
VAGEGSVALAGEQLYRIKQEALELAKNFGSLRRRKEAFGLNIL